VALPAVPQRAHNWTYQHPGGLDNCNHLKKGNHTRSLAQIYFKKDAIVNAEYSWSAHVKNWTHPKTHQSPDCLYRGGWHNMAGVLTFKGGHLSKAAQLQAAGHTPSLRTWCIELLD
jgi:hypothetical protein